MSDYIVIQWTCGSLDEARRVGRYLVQERLAACVNIIPWVESIFLWDEGVNTEQETKVHIKSRLELYDQVRKIIEENARYEVPEITYSLIDGGNAPYMQWLEETLANVEKQSQ